MKSYNCQIESVDGIWKLEASRGSPSLFVTTSMNTTSLKTTLTEAQKKQCEKLMKSYKYQTESVEGLWNRLRKGVSVQHNEVERKKYYFWVDDQDRLGVELFARALEVCWGQEERCWTYEEDKIPIINLSVEVAKLKDVCWLDVEAKFDTGILTEGIEYEVFFDIEMNRGGKGWNCIMKFDQKGPFDQKNNLEMRVDQLMGAGRIEIPMGKFQVPTEISVDSATKGMGSFKMYEHGGQWKDGLIVRGVIIKPVVYCKCSLSGTPTNVRKLSDVGKNKSK